MIPKLNKNLPLLHLRDLLAESNDMPNPEGYAIDDGIVVLVLKRSSVSFPEDEDEESPTSWLSGIPVISIKPNPEILAIVSVDNTGKIDIGKQPWSYFSDRIKQKISIALKAIIGLIGVYQFKRVWALTTPLSWRGESDIEIPTLKSPML